MSDHSKILVSYEVSSHRVPLGEVANQDGSSLSDVWRRTPSESLPVSGLVYRMSLFSIDGKMVADKAISMDSVNKLI